MKAGQDATARLDAFPMPGTAITQPPHPRPGPGTQGHAPLHRSAHDPGQRQRRLGKRLFGPEARLRAFAVFARRRSFSAAARELRISQPAVSKHIADVEREAGVKLVERRPRGGELTPAGEFLANHVLRAQALLAQAVRGVGEFRQRATGSLTIVASGVPATYLLPEFALSGSYGYAGGCQKNSKLRGTMLPVTLRSRNTRPGSSRNGRWRSWRP
ncbi:MAG TPA: LysR family transcriptional regulator, partial [Candidatus Dormibacteraeota bacterium]|nr:LysR family transcriptional regulator [Candidatus Dormibacteraeota bacterium]